MIKMIKNLVMLVCVLCTTESWAGTNVYRWVDEHGVVTYGDRPTPSAQILNPGKSIFPKDTTANNPRRDANSPKAAAPLKKINPDWSFSLVDQRPEQQSAGGINITAGVPLIYYPDKAMGIDRKMVLENMLMSRYFDKVKDTPIFLDKFSVVEGNMRNSFVRDATGKSIPNNGPHEKALIAEISLHVDENYFNGYSELKLAKGRATHDAIERVTIDAVNDLANKMGGEWRESNSDHSSYSF